jgi:DNA-binding GntR family transcriptional regulator
MVVGTTHRSARPEAAWLQAYDRLREQIVTCELSPGERLSEAGLAKMLGLSRTPVREALIRLHVEGVVKVSPQRGTFVTPIDPGAAAAAQLLRLSVEREVAQQAARHCDAAAKARLLQLLEFQKTVASTGDLRTFLQLDDDLHYAIFDIAGLSRLWSIVHGAKAQLDRVRFLTIRDPRQLGAVLVEHGEVVEALGARDARRAGQVMKRHLQTSYRIAEALANLSALPDQSSPRTDIPPDNKRRRLHQWQTGNLPGVGS